MSRRVGVTVVGLIALAAWLTWARHGADRAAGSGNAPDDIAVPARSGGSRIGANAAATDSSGEQAAPDLLDCAEPRGSIATVDGEGIAAAAFCAEWALVAGPHERGDPIVMEKQGRAVLATMINALLVSRALAADGRAVTEPEVDAALDELIAQRASAASPPTRAAFDDELQAQGSDIEHAT